jgi:serine/threonine protein kinase
MLSEKDYNQMLNNAHKICESPNGTLYKINVGSKNLCLKVSDKKKGDYQNDFDSAFIEEIVAMKNPGILTYFKAGVIEGLNYVVMELAGENLDKTYDIFTKNKDLFFEMIENYMLNVFNESNNKWLVHRDIKNPNIVFVDNKFKLCDLGSALLINDFFDCSNEGATTSTFGNSLGSFFYDDKNHETKKNTHLASSPLIDLAYLCFCIDFDFDIQFWFCPEYIFNGFKLDPPEIFPIDSQKKQGYKMFAYVMIICIKKYYKSIFVDKNTVDLSRAKFKWITKGNIELEKNKVTIDFEKWHSKMADYSFDDEEYYQELTYDNTSDGYRLLIFKLLLLLRGYSFSYVNKFTWVQVEDIKNSSDIDNFLENN